MIVGINIIKCREKPRWIIVLESKVIAKLETYFYNEIYKLHPNDYNTKSNELTNKVIFFFPEQVNIALVSVFLCSTFSLLRCLYKYLRSQYAEKSHEVLGYLSCYSFSGVTSLHLFNSPNDLVLPFWRSKYLLLFITFSI